MLILFIAYQMIISSSYLSISLFIYSNLRLIPMKYYQKIIISFQLYFSVPKFIVVQITGNHFSVTYLFYSISKDFSLNFLLSILKSLLFHMVGLWSFYNLTLKNGKKAPISSLVPYLLNSES